MKRKINFTKIVQLWGIIFLIGIGGSIVVIDIVGSYRDFNFRANQMRTDYTASQKQIIKQEVERVVDMIHYEKAQSEILIKRKIESRVYEAHAIAQYIYQKNYTDKSKDEIQKMIMDALKPIRFEQGLGYYYIIVRLDGVAVLFPSKPELEGVSLLDV
jgi:two-component system cell cycle sensor histidine kinase/response regulator CckA